MRCVQSFIFGLFLLQLARGEDNILGKTCPPTEAPENAEAIGNNMVGSVVKFLCKEGFYRLGNPHRIRCQSNGQWTKHNVFCVAVRCGDPGSPLNGKRKGWLFQYNNSVTFDCHRGFKLEGPNARTCLANQTWSGTQPICKPVTCEEPPKVPDAVIFGGRFVFGALVYYTCNKGYKLKGPDTLTCGEDGKWVGETPVCKVVTCADPGTPQHGSTNSTGPPFSYLSMIFYKCNDGYILYGSDRRSCVGEGEWTGVQPFCVECAGVNTPVFVRNGQRFIHGIIQQKSKNIVTVLIDSSKEQRDVAIFGPGTQHYIIVEDKLPSPKKIFLGMRVIAMQRGTYIFAKVDAINGDKYSVTFEDKQRTKQTVALEHIRNLFPPTFCATCSDPGKPNKGFRTDNLEEFIVRTEVEFGCEINTRLIGSSKRTCQPNGRWSGEQPTCEKCNEALDIHRHSIGSIHSTLNTLSIEVHLRKGNAITAASVHLEDIRREAQQIQIRARISNRLVQIDHFKPRVGEEEKKLKLSRPVITQSFQIWLIFRKGYNFSMSRTPRVFGCKSAVFRGCIMSGSAVLFREGKSYLKGRFVSIARHSLWEVLYGDKYSYKSKDEVLLDEKPTLDEIPEGTAVVGEDPRGNLKEGKIKRVCSSIRCTIETDGEEWRSKLENVRVFRKELC